MSNKRFLVVGLVAIVVTIAVAVGSAAYLSGGEDGDKVVGVTLKCETRAIAGGNQVWKEDAGASCNPPASTRNKRLVVIVKPPKGQPYTVEADAGTTVSIGDQWPPK